jgi:hypothetical protein
VAENKAALALWLAAANHCRLESLPAFQFLACAEQGEAPHQDSDCDTDACALVESGLYKAENNRITVDAPAGLVLLFLPPPLEQTSNLEAINHLRNKLRAQSLEEPARSRQHDDGGDHQPKAMRQAPLQQGLVSAFEPAHHAVVLLRQTAREKPAASATLKRSRPTPACRRSPCSSAPSRSS